MVNFRLFALTLGWVLLSATASYAQRFQPFGPLDFTQDWQPFAPAEISSYGGGPDPNTGFFFTYDRIHLYVNRPAQAFTPNKFDRSTGTRIDFGYMSNSENGWLGEFMRIEGPNVYDQPTDRKRDIVTINPSGINPVTGQSIIIEPPETTQNNLNGLAENVGSLNSFELSKLWRLKPLHRGSIVELFLGGRYATIKHLDNINYNPVWPAGVVPGAPPVPPFGFPPDTVPILAAVPGWTPYGVTAENKIFGPQIGLRWFKQKGRWTISAEGRSFFAVNHQHISGGYPLEEPVPRTPATAAAFGETMGYPLVNGTVVVPPNVGTVPVTIPVTVPLVPETRTVLTYDQRFWKWAPAGDVRVNVTWDITKAFALEAGWEMLYFANGIARGKGPTSNNPFARLNDQDMMFNGWTVGFVVNR